MKLEVRRSGDGGAGRLGADVGAWEGRPEGGTGQSIEKSERLPSEDVLSVTTKLDSLRISDSLFGRIPLGTPGGGDFIIRSGCGTSRA